MTARANRKRANSSLTCETLEQRQLLFEGQLIAAAHRGVQVRLITPLNPIGAPTNASDIAFLTSEGVNVRVTIDQYPLPNTLHFLMCQSGKKRTESAGLDAGPWRSHTGDPGRLRVSAASELLHNLKFITL
jgi:phosphatidylserine/phosphatidylglycerophosphate/cardiolipin synthase-like enzyme